MNEHARVRTPGDDARVDVAHTRRASNVQIAKLITHCICSLLDIVCVCFCTSITYSHAPLALYLFRSFAQSYRFLFGTMCAVLVTGMLFIYGGIVVGSLNSSQSHHQTSP